MHDDYHELSWNLQNLRILNLADNSLKKMLSSMFQGLRKLRYLDLSDNPLGELTPNVFSDVTVSMRNRPLLNF